MLSFHKGILGKTVHKIDVYGQLSSEMLYRNSETCGALYTRLFRKFFKHVVRFMRLFEDQEVGGKCVQLES